MFFKYCLIFVLTIVLIGLSFSKQGGLLEDLIKRNLSRTSWLKTVILMFAIHVWYCSLLLQDYSWNQLLLVWFVLFNVFGWIYASFLKPSPLFFLGLPSDLLGIGIGVWIIQRFIL